MRKKSLLILLAAVLLFTSCHGSKGREPFSMPESFDESRTYEITFWAKNDTNKTQVDIYNKAISDFEKIYPNIKVNLRLYTDYSRIYNDVITNISTDTTPNVCITYPDHVATYITGDQVVIPLDELMSDSQYGLGGEKVKFESPKTGEFVSKYLKEGRIGNLCYTLPFMRSTEALFINKTYVEKLGYEVPEKVTWDFVWEVSEKAMEKDSEDNYVVNGQKVMIPFIYKSTDNMMIQMLAQQKAGYSDENANILIFNDTTKNNLLEIAEHVKTGAFSTFKISSYPANFLNAGQCLFAVDSTAGSTWMGSKAPLLDIAPENVVEFETVVREIPQFDTENPLMISQGPSICVFNKKDPQEVLASWIFAQFLLTNEVQIAYAQTEGYVPVTKKAQTDPSYVDYLNRRGEDNNLHYDIKIDATELLIRNIDNTFTTPVFNGSASLRDAAGQLIEEVCKGIRRKKTVDSAFIDSVYASVTSLNRLDSLSSSVVSEKADLGPLPSASVWLIVVLCIVWLLIVVYSVYRVLIKRIKKQEKNK